MTATEGFAESLLSWFDTHGRHDLPWQQPRCAYRVWVSEIMLQQTQVATVIGYFQRFIDAFPDLSKLAAASEDQVLALWTGLGYYSRARNLRLAAQQCMQHHDGELPRSLQALVKLPGIGRSTAGAILAQAWGQPVAILDGNVKRVLCRYHAIDAWPGQRAVEQRLWLHAEQHLPARRAADYTQAIMDLGATVCRRSRPLCDACPVADGCLARQCGMTASLPVARPAKVLPERQRVMLVLDDGAGRVLLQKRNTPGVWAGLWSFPEYDDRVLAEFAARRHGSLKLSELARLKHSFSHYRLSATVLSGTARPQSIADAADQQWFDRAALDQVGLPAPVRKLLLASATDIFPHHELLER